MLSYKTKVKLCFLKVVKCFHMLQMFLKVTILKLKLYVTLQYSILQNLNSLYVKVKVTVMFLKFIYMLQNVFKSCKVFLRCYKLKLKLQNVLHYKVMFLN